MQNVVHFPYASNGSRISNEFFHFINCILNYLSNTKTCKCVPFEFKFTKTISHLLFKWNWCCCAVCAVCAYEMCSSLIQFGFNLCIFACTGVLIDIYIFRFKIRLCLPHIDQKKLIKKLDKMFIDRILVQVMYTRTHFSNVEQSRQIDQIEESFFSHFSW